MARYETIFIQENVAPQGNEFIDIQDESGKSVGKIKTNIMKIPRIGDKLYSFGALSDVHVNNAAKVKKRFENAIKYFTDEEQVAFTCIAGDLTGSGTLAHYQEYILSVIMAKKSCSRIAVVHDTTGNHDVQQDYAPHYFFEPFLNDETIVDTTNNKTALDKFKEYAETQYGKTYEELGITEEELDIFRERPVHYSFTKGNDVFIMFGMDGWPGKTYPGGYNNTLFYENSLKELHRILDANRDKRCFVFEHCPHFTVTKTDKGDGTGTTYSKVTDGSGGTILGWVGPTGGYLNDRKSTFMKLMQYYSNVVWFHGHTHIHFKHQADCSILNYNKKLGCHSVHIPALAGERKMTIYETAGDDGAKGFGYVVDVYNNHIVLRGRDFSDNVDKFSPIATYCVDTTFKPVESKTLDEIKAMTF